MANQPVTLLDTEKGENSMSEQSIVTDKIKELYKKLCQSEWDATVTGLVVAFFSVLIMAWWRPWGAVGALRNWGDWILYGLALLFQSESGVFSF